MWVTKTSLTVCNKWNLAVIKILQAEHITSININQFNPAPYFEPGCRGLFPMLNDLLSEVIVRFADIGGIIDNQYLKFLFIIVIYGHLY